LRAEYTVLVGGSGQEALELLDKHPDLVVIERRLPDVDGLELCRLLHDQSHAPIVMFAPSADKRDTILALENGADDVIDDVSSPPVLVARVRAVLRRYPQRKPGV
jgi:DNA-binding response OmpR family regulator